MKAGVHRRRARFYQAGRTGRSDEKGAEVKQLRTISLIWLLPAVLFALSAAPAAQATQHRTPVPLITEHSFGQNGVPRATVPSGPLITEHSAGQNRPLHVSRQTVPLITEHSYGPKSAGSAARERFERR